MLVSSLRNDRQPKYSAALLEGVVPDYGKWAGQAGSASENGNQRAGPAD